MACQSNENTLETDLCVYHTQNVRYALSVVLVKSGKCYETKYKRFKLA